MTEPDFMHELDDLIQSVTAIKTGKTTRVPIVHRPLSLGTDASELLRQEYQAAKLMLDEKNKRTRALRARKGKTLKRSL